MSVHICWPRGSTVLAQYFCSLFLRKSAIQFRAIPLIPYHPSLYTKPCQKSLQSPLQLHQFAGFFACHGTSHLRGREDGLTRSIFSPATHSVQRDIEMLSVHVCVRPSRIICFLLNILGTNELGSPNLVCRYFSWKS